jgi:hypothetical protein
MRDDGTSAAMLAEQGAFDALVKALTERWEDTAFTHQMVEALLRLAALADASRAMARAPACVESLAMLMRTHTHSVSLVRGCCALMSALCVDEESARLVGQPQVFSAISTAMYAATATPLTPLVGAQARLA